MWLRSGARVDRGRRPAAYTPWRQHRACPEPSAFCSGRYNGLSSAKQNASLRVCGWRHGRQHCTATWYRIQQDKPAEHVDLTSIAAGVQWRRGADIWPSKAERVPMKAANWARIPHSLWVQLACSRSLHTRTVRGKAHSGLASRFTHPTPCWRGHAGPFDAYCEQTL